MNNNTTSPDDDARGDGRTERRARNRAAVIASLIVLFDNGEFHPTAVQIVTPTTLSLRSVFRYFTDLADLTVATIETQRAEHQHWHLPNPPAAAPVTQRVQTVAEHHLRWTATTRTYRRAVHAHRTRLPTLEDHVHQWDQLAWTHTGTWFAPELRHHRDPELVHAALAAIVHPDHLDTLTERYHLDPTRTHQVLTRTLHALLHLDPDGTT